RQRERERERERAHPPTVSGHHFSEHLCMQKVQTSAETLPLTLSLSRSLALSLSLTHTHTHTHTHTKTFRPAPFLQQILLKKHRRLGLLLLRFIRHTYADRTQKHTHHTQHTTT